MFGTKEPNFQRKSYSVIMKLYDIIGKEFNLQEIDDTGWESLYEKSQDEIIVKGRIVNGIATLVFEGLQFDGSGKIRPIVIPNKYIPKTKPFDFSLHTNNATPQLVFCGFDKDGFYVLTNSNIVTKSLVGTVTYPV